MSGFFIYYADEAKDDLRNIFMYIAYDLGSRDNATGQVNRIREAISALVNFPKRNPLVPYEPWRSLGMRRLNVDNYTVLYLTNEKQKRVEIVRIPYGARDLDRFFEQELN